MNEICKVCGLQRELCLCKEREKEEQKSIKIKPDKRKYGKPVTLVLGINLSKTDADSKNLLKDICKYLKSGLSCGGTVKDGVIELQGEHAEQVKQLLIKKGFKEEGLEVLPDLKPKKNK